MAVILYGRELRQDQRTKRRQLEEQTEAQERAALGSSSSGRLGKGSNSGADAGASSGRLPTELQARASSRELQARVDTRRRHHREDSLLIMLNRPQVWTLNMSTSDPYTTLAVLAIAIRTIVTLPTKVWTLNIWVWLLLYPSVTRKALQTFDCIELLGETYLRADPAINCSGGDWWFMAVLAAVGVFVTCILAPLALVRQTSPNPTLTLTPTLTPTFNPTLNPNPDPAQPLPPPGAADLAQARLVRARAALARRAVHQHLQGRVPLLGGGTL